MKLPPQNQPLYLKQTDSTNRELWRMLDSGNDLTEGFCISAGLQTAGRGQGNSIWQSEANNNLILSILLKPHFLPPGKQFMLNKSVALAIRATLEELTDGLVFAIKWPNDIYCLNKKIAGTLIENRIQGNLFEISIAGIGININQTSFPKNIPNPGSLKMLTGVSYDLENCLGTLLKIIYQYYNLLRDDKEDTINAEYLNNMLGYQEYKLYSHDKNEFRAMITGVNEYGKLILKDENEMLREYGVKEVVFVLNDQA
jgi:BirA family transcriptional regulator, biotin operon repressor / biotin---[acetyl-CoA-carboxylase] ligase